jgi:hypothetical protein
LKQRPLSGLVLSEVEVVESLSLSEVESLSLSEVESLSLSEVEGNIFKLVNNIAILNNT